MVFICTLNSLVDFVSVITVFTTDMHNNSAVTYSSVVVFIWAGGGGVLFLP